MQETKPAYLGLYINLERSPERRAAFEKQLSDLNLQSGYSRFPAVDGLQIDTSRSPLRPGEVGLFHSHCRAVEQARGKGMCVHVLEDDALLSEHVVPVLNDVVSTDLFERYDVIFTDMMIHCHVGFLRNVQNEFDKMVPFPNPLRLQHLRLIDLSQVFYAGSQSYIVGRHSIDRVVSLYREEMAKGPTLPVDIFLQQQAVSGRLRAACLFPSSRAFGSKRLAKARSAMTQIPAYRHRRWLWPCCAICSSSTRTSLMRNAFWMPQQSPIAKHKTNAML